jgi:hypothetical protein
MRTHSATGIAATGHNEVQLIDEQNNANAFLALLLDLAQDRFDTLLVLALELGARHQRTHIQAEQAPEQRSRNIALDDSLRQPFSNRSLADTRLADKHGVVLRSSAENPNGSSNLVVASDDRVELALLGEAGEVDGILGESIEALFGVFAVDATVPAGLLYGGLDSCGGEGCFFKDGDDGGVLDEREDQVVLGNVRVVLEVTC